MDGARLDGCRRRHVGRHVDHPRAAAAHGAHRRRAQALRASRSRDTRCCGCSASPDRDGCRWRAPSHGCRCIPTSVTNTVDRLVRDGFVVREPHPIDGRAAMLVLTRRRARLVERATDALNTEVFADAALAEDDMVELVRILARFRKDAGDFTDPGRCPTR